MKPRELLDRAERGDVRNVRFTDLQRLVEALGFRLERVRGSHHTYRHPGVRAIVNLQPLGRQAKPYQVRQVVDVVAQYALTVKDGA